MFVPRIGREVNRFSSISKSEIAGSPPLLFIVCGLPSLPGCRWQTTSACCATDVPRLAQISALKSHEECDTRNQLPVHMLPRADGNWSIRRPISVDRLFAPGPKTGADPRPFISSAPPRESRAAWEMVRVRAWTRCLTENHQSPLHNVSAVAWPQEVLHQTPKKAPFTSVAKHRRNTNHNDTCHPIHRCNLDPRPSGALKNKTDFQRPTTARYTRNTTSSPNAPVRVQSAIFNPNSSERGRLAPSSVSGRDARAPGPLVGYFSDGADCRRRTNGQSPTSNPVICEPSAMDFTSACCRYP